MSEKCIFCGKAIPEGRQVCPGCEKNDEKTLKGYIDHFDTVATMGRIDGRPAKTYEEVAAYLKRLRYYEEAIRTGRLAWKEG